MQDFNRLISREQKLEFQENLLRIRDKVEGVLLKIPGVVHVGVGIKKKDGTLTDTPCLRVYVERKKTLAEIPKDHIIPAEAEGVLIDVIEIERLSKEIDSKKYRPLVGGCQIMNAEWKSVSVGTGTGSMTFQGTLGCFSKRNSDNKIVLLSNYHVLTWGGATTDDPIGQPLSPCVCGCCTCGHVAVIGALVDDSSFVDCGYAILNEDVTYTNSIVDIGYVTGTAAAILNEKVRKYGSTTGLTEGTVTEVSGIALVGSVTYSDQIEVTPTVSHPFFTRKGDSGSVYVNSNNKVIALHMGGATTAWGNNISRVETALGITILATQAPEGVIPFAGYHKTESAAPFIEQLLRMEDQFWNINPASEASQKFVTARNEIADLLRNNREVRAAWSRYQGPAFIGHMNRAALENGYQVPSLINGISWKNLLIRMSSVFETHGSENLRELIDKHAAEILQLDPDPAIIRNYLRNQFVTENISV
jgi:hypothetical protein